MKLIIATTILHIYLLVQGMVSLTTAVLSILTLSLLPLYSSTRKREKASLVIVGYGGAGSCAALQAAEEAAKKNKEYKIVILERFDGGGATLRSGGVCYAGGGTKQQEYTEVEDNPENMFKYLKAELEDSVSEELIRKFCHSSASDISWLQSYGVPINQANHIGKCYPKKASMPPAGYTLYFSGSENAAPFNRIAKPAQRGHMPSGTRNTVGGGFHIFNALRVAVSSSSSIQVRLLSKAKSLILGPDEDNGVSGVNVVTLEGAPVLIRKLFLLAYTINSTISPFRPFDKISCFIISWIERWYGTEYVLESEDGIILAAGGFGRNEKMVEEYIPKYKGLFNVAPMGSDGSGICLGTKIGACTAMMQSGASWKFLYPPFSFTKGILVNQFGQRICNEDVYGARLGKVAIEDNKGLAWFIIDRRIYEEAMAELQNDNDIPFAPKFQGYLNLYVNRYKRVSLVDLAQACGFASKHKLQETILRYNKFCSEGKDEDFGKARESLQPLLQSPFYAINYCAKNKYWFTPWLTMGGLKVEETTGLVIRGKDKSIIKRLYAAGRNASGLPSKSYVSGLSIADCVYSGRRAGRHAVLNGT